MPDFPQALGYLWQAFNRMRRRAGEGPIAFAEIDAFIRLTGTRLRPWEVELIEALDNEFIACASRALQAAQEDG